MSERFVARSGSVASGTAKALWNLFNTAASPTTRGRIYDLTVGSVATPADQAANFSINRTSAVGTEGSGYTPINLDPGGPAGSYDCGQGAFSVEPTKTSNAELLGFPLNQRATFRWVAAPGGELALAATQNHGACLETKTSTSTQTHDSTVWFME